MTRIMRRANDMWVMFIFVVIAPPLTILLRLVEPILKLIFERKKES